MMKCPACIGSTEPLCSHSGEEAASHDDLQHVYGAQRLSNSDTTERCWKADNAPISSVCARPLGVTWTVLQACGCVVHTASRPFTYLYTLCLQRLALAAPSGG